MAVALAPVLILWTRVLAAPVVARFIMMQRETGHPSTLENLKFAYDWLTTHEADDDADSAVLSEHYGRIVRVETFTGAFELRKLMIRWGRSSGAAGGADDAVTTHHFVKLVAGVPSDAWVAADFIAAEGRFTTFWNALKPKYVAGTVLKQYRWYKAGPAIVPPQLPVRIADPNLPGTSAGGTAQLPPQLAISVTEKTVDAKSWGRFYLPPINTLWGNVNGRIDPTVQAAIADAADAMYEGFITDGLAAVVYSTAKPERETKAGTTLPERVARALPVKQIQVDDLWDVIRSRRWNEPLLRLQRDTAGS